MVFTNNQITTVFEGADKMGLPAWTQVHLQTEGINSPTDLFDFVKDSAWSQVIENCKRPPYIPDSNNDNALIAQEYFQFPAKLLIHLKVAAQAVVSIMNWQVIPFCLWVWCGINA